MWIFHRIICSAFASKTFSQNFWPSFEGFVVLCCKGMKALYLNFGPLWKMRSSSRFNDHFTAEHFSGRWRWTTISSPRSNIYWMWCIINFGKNITCSLRLVQTMQQQTVALKIIGFFKFLQRPSPLQQSLWPATNLWTRGLPNQIILIY